MAEDLYTILSRSRVDTSDLYDRLDELRDERSAIESNIENAQEEASEQQDIIDNETNDAGELSDEGMAATYALSSANVEEEQYKQELAEWDEENKEELDKLEEIESDFGGVIPREFTLIAESDFEDYAREMAEDIGAINRHAAWPANCIDWEQAANELKMDYSVIELESTTYYYRE
jgi:chromosome segregation ATPase